VADPTCDSQRTLECGSGNTVVQRLSKTFKDFQRKVAEIETFE